MDKLKLEQLAGLWVDGRRIAYMAAAIVRFDRDGDPQWSLLVVNAVPAIVAEEMAVQLVTRDEVAYTSRARRRGETQTKVHTTIIDGTESLAVIGAPSSSPKPN